jgi:hypothetical protein
MGGPKGEARGGWIDIKRARAGIALFTWVFGLGGGLLGGALAQPMRRPTKSTGKD